MNGQVKSRVAGLLALVAASAACANALEGFERDHAYNENVIHNSLFYSVESNKDNCLTEADAKGWAKYSGLDAAQDGVITYDEFRREMAVSYPEWPGEVHRNVVYKRAGDETLLLDVFPPLVRKYEKAPVFYYVHGGGWSGGRKELHELYQPLFKKLSKEGVACVSVMYRLVKMWNKDDPVRMSDCVVDCQDGLRFLKKHEDVLALDTDRVVVFGDSAGSHLAQLLAWSDPDAFPGDAALAPYDVSPIAGVSWYGPSDFRKAPRSDPGKAAKFKPDHWARLITKGDRFVYEELDEATRRVTDRLSPVTWLNEQSAPVIHFHGEEDPVIPPAHAAHLKQYAEKTGAPVAVQMVKDAAHGWYGKDCDPSREEIIQACVDFVLRQLRPSSPSLGRPHHESPAISFQPR